MKMEKKKKKKRDSHTDMKEAIKYNYSKLKRK